MFGEIEQSNRQIGQTNTLGAYFGWVFRVAGINRSFNLPNSSSWKGGAGCWKSARATTANRSDHVQIGQNLHTANPLRNQT